MLHHFMISVKRIYQPKSPSDGYRILVDRLWPRGISKQAAAIDLWMKDIGPSSELRQWFGHEPAKWPEFREKYHKELTAKEDMLEEVKTLANKHENVTLLYSAKDEKRNQAVVIAELLGG